MNATRTACLSEIARASIAVIALVGAGFSLQSNTGFDHSVGRGNAQHSVADPRPKFPTVIHALADPPAPKPRQS